MRKQKNEEGKKDNKTGKKTKKFSLVKVVLVAIAIIILCAIGAFGRYYAEGNLFGMDSDNKYWALIADEQSIWSFSGTNNLNIEFPDDSIKSDNEVKYFDSFTDFKNSTKITLSESKIVDKLKEFYNELKDEDIREENMKFVSITKNRDKKKNYVVYRSSKHNVFLLWISEDSIGPDGLIPLVNTKLNGTYRTKKVYGIKDSEEIEKAQRMLDSLPSVDISNDTLKVEDTYFYFASYNSMSNRGNSEYKSKDKI